LGMVVGVIFVIFAFVFFRDNAKDCGLSPDGSMARKKHQKSSTHINKEYTLKEALRQYSFWIFNLSFALNALYVTALTFNIVSIFNEAGLDRTRAISIFLPASFVAVSINFIGGWLSDYIRLKYLLMLNMLGIVLSAWALTQLDSFAWAYWVLVLGNGIFSGIFSVVNTVTWPRFFGTKHLGSISGFAMSWTVIASAFGPYLFSLALKFTGSYTVGIAICVAMACVLFVLALRANNVQR
jgi:OFA family oxalate/formate antiporter-like MFS transporter